MKTRFAIHKARKGVRTYGNAYPKNPYLVSTYLTWPTKLRAFDSYIDLYDFADRLQDITQNQDIKNLCETVLCVIILTSDRSTHSIKSFLATFQPAYISP